MALFREDTFRQWLSSPALAHRQCLHIFLEVQVHELEDEVEFVAICVNNVEQSHDIRVVHLLQQADFANGSGRDAFIFGFETDLLEGDDALVGRGQVAGLVNDAIGACEPK